MSSVSISGGDETSLPTISVDGQALQGVKKYKLSQGEGEAATLEVEVDAASVDANTQVPGVTVTTKEVGGGPPEGRGQGRNK